MGHLPPLKIPSPLQCANHFAPPPVVFEVSFASPLSVGSSSVVETDQPDHVRVISDHFLNCHLPDKGLAKVISTVLFLCDYPLPI